MAPVEGSIELLSQAVMREADAAAGKVMETARAKAEAILSEARQQADAERRKILEKARQDVERTRRQAVASAQIRARMIELEQREQLLAEVFAASREKLASLQKHKDYDAVAERLLREALAALGAQSVEVRADAATRRALTKDRLAKIGKELNVKLGLKGQLEEGSGLVAEAGDGRMQYDNTLETRLDRMRNALRSPVYHILMGEAL